MKTFEQYINESRQKYIFGGTDDRNTIEAPKTFAELEPGDTFYWYRDINGSKPTAWKFVLKDIVEGEKDETRLYVDANHDCFCRITDSNQNMNRTSYKDEAVGVRLIGATTLEEFLDLVRKNNVQLKEDDILDGID